MRDSTPVNFDRGRNKVRVGLGAMPAGTCPVLQPQVALVVFGLVPEVVKKI